MTDDHQTYINTIRPRATVLNERVVWEKTRGHGIWMLPFSAYSALPNRAPRFVFMPPQRR